MVNSVCKNAEVRAEVKRTEVAGTKRASKRQKEPSIALIFYKLPLSCALSRQISRGTQCLDRTVQLPIDSSCYLFE